MSNFRMEKVNAEMQRLLSTIITTEISTPELKGVMVSVTKVAVASDFSTAKVFVSFYGKTDEEKAFKALEGSLGYLRKRVAEKMNLKKTPKFILIKDDLADNAFRINQILDDLKKKGEL